MTKSVTLTTEIYFYTHIYTQGHLLLLQFIFNVMSVFFNKM